jgi:sialic acid synthase SpsE
MNYKIVMTTEEILKTLDRQELLRRLGLKSSSSVSNAINDGIMPPEWYLTVKTMCDEKGLDCPEALFRWRDFSGQEKAS